MLKVLKSRVFKLVQRANMLCALNIASVCMLLTLIFVTFVHVPNNPCASTPHLGSSLTVVTFEKSMLVANDCENKLLRVVPNLQPDISISKVADSSEEPA